MVYTEIKSINGKRYYYRALSLRKSNKILKKRVYLGCNLSNSELSKKEKMADEQLLHKKRKRMNKEIEKIKLKMINILKKYKVKKAGIFGSYARGEQKKNSDIDILIEPPKDMGLEFIGLQLELTKTLRKKVDLVSYKYIHHSLKDKILKSEIKII
jgi:predicted nucleotidyltransferase